jgi:hypothetical protein
MPALVGIYGVFGDSDGLRKIPSGGGGYAGSRDRTRDFQFTKLALYQLSYTGIVGRYCTQLARIRAPSTPRLPWCGRDARGRARAVRVPPQGTPARGTG